MKYLTLIISLFCAGIAHADLSMNVGYGSKWMTHNNSVFETSFVEREIYNKKDLGYLFGKKLLWDINYHENIALKHKSLSSSSLNNTFIINGSSPFFFQYSGLINFAPSTTGISIKNDAGFGYQYQKGIYLANVLVHSSHEHINIEDGHHLFNFGTTLTNYFYLSDHIHFYNETQLFYGKTIGFSDVTFEDTIASSDSLSKWTNHFNSIYASTGTNLNTETGFQFFINKNFGMEITHSYSATHYEQVHVWKGDFILKW